MLIGNTLDISIQNSQWKENKNEGEQISINGSKLSMSQSNQIISIINVNSSVANDDSIQDNSVIARKNKENAVANGPFKFKKSFLYL